jgi:hypothetical protein
VTDSRFDVCRDIDCRECKNIGSSLCPQVNVTAYLVGVKCPVHPMGVCWSYRKKDE